MKRCSPSLAIKEMQIKTTLRMWGKRNPNPLLVGMQAGATTLEKNLETS
jgi:hypothetical protein